MRKVRITLALFGIAAALIGGALAIPASAASVQLRPLPPDPPDGYVYVFDGTSFAGATCRWFGDDADYRFNSNGCDNWNDRVRSAFNNGYNNAFPDVMFFENINYTGHSICLHNGEAWSTMPVRDGFNWDNRVSSHKWVNCN